MGKPTANQNGIHYKLDGRLKRKACTEADGPRPTLESAIEAALADLRVGLGHNVVQEAIESATVAGHSGWSSAELQWLEEWCETHEAPETTTTQMAESAMRSQRTSSNSSFALVKLQEVQLLQAQHRAAERGVERAQARLQRVTAELDQRHLAKRKCTEQPEWSSREYGAWPDSIEYWRQEEGRAYNRYFDRQAVHHRGRHVQPARLSCAHRPLL